MSEITQRNGTKKWHVKKQHDGSANFNDLAELTYYKNIDKLKIDKEAYKAQKESLIKKHGVDEEELTSVVDLLNEPDAKTKVQVVSFLSEANDKRMKRRRNDKDEQDVDSFINEKNKQFNMKLNRQVNKADR
ncbi:Pre-mRNA-splicing factor SYF2 [Candida viswanathii]|uniref:Pre-mRNA-splicing factor SYF2 n=1 Tax=Candida viswanathii TaxID=5486 RepID=A0A367YK98_9ASCO|nr:Pre-mRNA-splicing factor SYF2 [Candida viswanathii]